MNRVTTIGELRDNLQQLETSILQSLNANPPENVATTLHEAQQHLKKCRELTESPLKIALIGEANSGSNLLVNAFLDKNDVVPYSTKGNIANVVEVVVTLRNEERPAQFKNAQIIFFNEEEIWDVLNNCLGELSQRGLSHKLPAKINSTDELANLEDKLISSFDEVSDTATQNNIASVLELVIAIKNNASLVIREENYHCEISKKLLGEAAYLMGRPSPEQGIQQFHAALQQQHETYGSYQPKSTINKKKIRNIFSLIKKATVNVEAWCVPFGVEDAANQTTLSYISFPEVAPDRSTPRDRVLCRKEMAGVHAVLAVMNAANGNQAGAALVPIFQMLGRTVSDRAIPVVGQFEDFPVQPEDSAANFASAFSALTAAANKLGARGGNLQICAPISYLYEIRSKRSNWDFGKKEWFSDSKREAAYSLYKRSQGGYQKVSGDKIMSQACQNYLDGGGIPAIREAAVRVAQEKGDRSIKDEAMKEFNAACNLLNTVAPGGTSGSERVERINPEVALAAQDYYRVLELAVADALPGGASGYKSLTVKMAEEDLPLWDIIEKEIASSVASWPEWFAILNQSQLPQSQLQPKSDKPQRSFSRYKKLKKSGAEVPAEFKAFNERFTSTADALGQFAIDQISQACIYSVQKFETHPDFIQAAQELQGQLDMEALPQNEEALPLIDSWQPSQMAQEDLIPEILERIHDELEDLQNIRYPYDGDKPCFWNLALIIRIQVQLIKTLRDKVSRLIAAAENQFQHFFVGEVLRAEILPLVRSCLNNSEFLATVTTGSTPVETESSWEETGQGLRAAMNNVQGQSRSPIKAAGVAKGRPQQSQPEFDNDDESFEFEADKGGGNNDDMEEW